MSEPSPDPLSCKILLLRLNTFLCQASFPTPSFAHTGRICTTLGCYVICLSLRQVRMTSIFIKFCAQCRQCIASPRFSEKHENRGMSLGCDLSGQELGLVRKSICSCLGDYFLLPVIGSFLQPSSSVTSQMCLTIIMDTEGAADTEEKKKQLSHKITTNDITTKDYPQLTNYKFSKVNMKHFKIGFEQ